MNESPDTTNEYFRPSGRKIETDKTVEKNLCGEKLANYQFQRLVAKGKKFTKCDFSQSEFDACYLRNCVFDSCDFTGCKFTNTNLRGSNFNGCLFDYVQFSHTLVGPELLENGGLRWKNLEQKFARTLRMNFHQIGDVPAVNKAIKIELQATRIHLYKAWHSRDPYFRKKYFGFERILKFVEWLKFIALDFFWGNGESAYKLTRSLLILVVVIAVCDVISLKNCEFSSYGYALVQAVEVLLGVTAPPNFSGWVLATIAGLRFILIACLVSILIKRLSWR